MSRLGIRIGRFSLINPVICGSGEHVMTPSGIRAALGAGAAGVIAKSVNGSPHAASQLDIADYVLVRPDNRPGPWGEGGDRAILCRSGLAQVSLDQWFAELARLDREAARGGQFVAASIIPAGLDAAAELARRAGEAGLRVLELNVGSPHALEAVPGTILLEEDALRLGRLVGEIRAAFGGQLWLKLPGLGTNLDALARAGRAAGADAVVLCGRFMAMLPDVETHRPVMGSSGGYSGGWALPITCRWLALARRAAGAACPLIGTNGVRSGLDVARVLLAGASAAELTSLVLQAGFAALGSVIAELDGYLAEQGLAAPDLVGRAADALGAYGAQAARPGRWRDFVPPETIGEG